MVKNIKDLQKFILVAITFLVPISFLPIFPNILLTPKLIVLSFGVVAVVVLKAIETILSGKLEFKVGKFDIPVLLLLIAYAASAILRTPNKMEAFFLPGTATIFISAAIYYFLINQLSANEKKIILISTALSGIIVSLISLLSAGKVFASIASLPDYIKATTFTTLGGNLPVIIFLAGLIPAIIGIVVTETKIAPKVIYSVLLALLTIGLLGNIYLVLPGKPASPQLENFNTSWFVAVDTLKESPILGIGPGNYLTAFNRLRPLTYNTTPLWAIRFTNARDFFLSVVTETGLLGLAGLVLMLIAIYRSFQEQRKHSSIPNWDIEISPNFIALIILLILFVLFEPEMSSILLLFLLLSLNTKDKTVNLNLSAASSDSNDPTSTSNFPAYIIAVPFIVAAAVFYFLSVRGVRAEYTFNQSLATLASNDGGKTYDLLTKAIQLNPYIDRYHATMAQVTLGISNSIAQNATANAQADEQGQVQISDADRQTITQLIQQSINEAKATVSLNPQRSGNWELLGNTYRSVMTLAQGADQFTIQSYSQAVALDPISPTLRISLGGVYFALGDYDNAIDTFKIAVLAKPDLANARYNLAAAYREKKEYDKAIAEMTVVLSLLDKNSPDYETAKKELDALEANKPTTAETQPTEGGELNAPEIPTEPVVNPPIDLPENAQPPEANTTPTPTASQSPNPSASQSPNPTIEP